MKDRGCEEKFIPPAVYAGRLKDREALLKSSSGGAFTAVSDVFLNRGDAVACSVYDYESHTMGFRLITTREERDAARGSKYMQSRMGGIYREAAEWLKGHPEKKLLFAGMGCQADGFRRYAELTGLRERVFLVDIICHGSSSPGLWKEYVQSLERRHRGTVSLLTFKDKRYGWRIPTALVNINKEEILLGDYVRVFYSQCALRPSCHVCPYASMERETDMTIGDYWKIEKVMPDFYDPAGNSLFLIHTARGMELFREIGDAIEYRKSCAEDCLQPNLERPTAASGQRAAFWRDYREHGADYVVKKYGARPFKELLKEKMKIPGRILRRVISG